jgi:hypothetical protein
VPTAGEALQATSRASVAVRKSAVFMRISAAR